MITEELETKEKEEGFSIYDIKDNDEDLVTQKNKLHNFDLHYDLYSCRCCGSDQHEEMTAVSSQKAKRGLIELLYIARIHGQDVRACPKCVSTLGLLLNYGGSPVLAYDYKKGKYVQDLDKIKRATGILDNTESTLY